MDIAEDDQASFVMVRGEEVWVELQDLCDDWQWVVMFVLSECFDSINMLGQRSEKPVPDKGEYCSKAERDDGNRV